MRMITGLMLFAAAATAQVTYYPGVASAPGANQTQWRTQVILHNPSGRIADALLSIQPFGSATTTHSKEFRLGGGDTLGLDDLYADLGAGTGAGVLKVDGPILAWVRTYNQGAGTFGQNIPPVDPKGGYAAGTAVHFPLRVPANVATDFRSNLMLFNLTPRRVHFTLRSGSYAASLDLDGGTALLVNNAGAFLGLPFGPAPLTVTADGPWTGLVSTVDPAFGDPTTVEGLADAAGEGLRYAGVAYTPGANQTHWRSDLFLFNVGGGLATARLTLTPLGSTQSGSPVDFPLSGGELFLIEDIYAFFGQESGAGVLTVEGAVMAWVRTFNQGDEGTFGQNIPPLSVGTAFEAGAPYLFPLQTARNVGTDFRSNLMLLNPGGTDLNFQLQADGTSYPVTLPGGTALLLDAVGHTMGLRPGLTTLMVEADGPWAGFVSTVDPTLGDPTTVAGLPASFEIPAPLP